MEQGSESVAGEPREPLVTAIRWMNAGTIRVENAGDLDLHDMLPVVVEEQCFSTSLSFVIAGARTDRIDVAPIVLGLGMDRRVAVNLAGRGL